MKIAVMQPYLFPYLGYFQMMHAVDQFVLFDDVNYINKGWINRNRILVGGNPHTFTLPLIKASQNKHINEIDIDLNDKWKAKFMRTLEMSYKKAPHFEVVKELLTQILAHDTTNLADFIQHGLETINAYIGIDTPLVRSSESYPNEDLKAQDRIVDICLKAEATEYVNAIGGKELYQQETFLKNGLHLFFIEALPFQYDQFGKEFAPHLSIIDVLMHLSKEEVQEQLNRYKLV